MSTLVVFAFKSEDGAKKALSTLEALQKQKLVDVQDAAIVTRKADGKPNVKQLHSMVGIGALGGAFWGMLIGLLFFMPFLGLAIGALSGAVAGKFSDIGIDDNFIKQVSEEIQAGQSGLFLLVGNVVWDRVEPSLKELGATIVKTNLSTEQEAKLREAFGAEQA
jgi:uncharacterized membrane protein